MPDAKKAVTATRELRPLILFDKLDVEEIRLIHGLTTTVEFAKGHQLFAEGDPGDCLYVLVSGTVRIELLRGGKHTPVAKLGDGAVIGEVGLLVKEKRSATAFAETDVKLLSLPREKFLAELSKGTLAAHKVVINIARDMAKKLRDMNKQLADLATHSKPGELASLRNELLKEWTF